MIDTIVVIIMITLLMLPKKAGEIYFSIIIPAIVFDSVIRLCMGYHESWFQIILSAYLAFAWVYFSIKDYDGHATIDEDDITIFPPHQIHI